MDHKWASRTRHCLTREGTKIPVSSSSHSWKASGKPRSVKLAAGFRGRRRRTHNHRQVGRPQLPLAELQGARGCFWACAQRLHVQVRKLAVALTCVFIQEVPNSFLCSEASPWVLVAHAESSGPEVLASQKRPQEPCHGCSHLGLGTRSHSPGRANQTRKEISRPSFRSPSNEEKNRTEIDCVLVQWSPLFRPFGRKKEIANHERESPEGAGDRV